MSTPSRNAMLNVLQEVAQERGRQYAQWGQQDIPLLCPGVENLDDERHGYEHMAEDMRYHNDYRFRAGILSWDAVLREEVYEAFAESDIAKARTELIQVAAVAVAAVESIDRLHPKARAA